MRDGGDCSFSVSGFRMAATDNCTPSWTLVELLALIIWLSVGSSGGSGEGRSCSSPTQSCLCAISAHLSAWRAMSLSLNLIWHVGHWTSTTSQLVLGVPRRVLCTAQEEDRFSTMTSPTPPHRPVHSPTPHQPKTTLHTTTSSLHPHYPPFPCKICHHLKFCSLWNSRWQLSYLQGFCKFCL